MWLKFTKMHGIGNDFIVLDGITTKIKLSPAKIKRLSDRNFGIGCDQILVVEAPTEPDIDFNYRIFNSDGTEVEQCGNGARCFAKYVFDRKLTGKKTIRVQTSSGKYDLVINKDHSYSVNMGEPRFSPEDIPFDTDQVENTYSLDTSIGNFELSTVSMGNPHGVLEVEDIETAPVLEAGPLLENHSRFPNKANIGFMQILSRTKIKLRVFERGAGETLACGTGACAAVAAGIRLGKLDNKVEVQLPGGIINIYWPGEGTHVMLTGPAKTVFQGQIRI